MENDSRIIKSIGYLEGALRYLDNKPLNSFSIKSAIRSIRTAKTTLKNTKTDLRLMKIENDMQMLKELILKKGLKHD